MTKRAIREIEENLPTITESIMKMNSTARLLHLLPYSQVRKNLAFNQAKCINLLDIGCGDGLFLRKVIDVPFGGQDNLVYVGVDISARKILVAKRTAQKFKLLKTHFVLADAEHLPFRFSVFNVVTMIEVLEHLMNLGALIKELNRTVSVDGKLIITTPSAYGANGSFLNILKRLIFLQRSVGNREKYILIQGKLLPHRDFTLNEIMNILSPNFTWVKIYSFNFRVISHLLTRVLPHEISELFVSYLENHAPQLPNAWGNNWLICAKKS